MGVDERWMRLAIEQARAAADGGEIPVGAVAVDADGNLLAATHNLCETHQMPTHHAELLAVEQACAARGSWRLSDVTVYVTLEPCPMCMGALIHARVSRVVFGAPDPRAGACGSLLRLTDYPLESSPQICGGVFGEDCLQLLRNFFQKKRITKYNNNNDF